VRFPVERTGITSDNGRQFVARDFKALVRIRGMTQHGESFV
jgi:hypothetical protein